MALSVVYPPKGSTNIHVSTVDIVAVHGLGGDAIDTWTHPTSNVFWLKDFLPHQIPDARILTFGYNAAVAFGQSTAEVIDHAKSLLSSLVDKREEPEEKDRPLIFIAHSLGGIVVKQALLQAHLEPRYQPIRDATVGILFFGTPHRGSEKASYGKVLASVAQAVSRRPPPRLLSALQTNSDLLLRLTTEFRFQLPQYHVVSFYEQRPTSALSSLIVEKHSALLEVEHEEQIPVDANHSEICKFETDESDTFEKAYKRIRRMRNEPRLRAKDSTKSYNKFFEVPHLLSVVFTGQDEVCQQLDRSLILARTYTQTHAQMSRQPVQRRFVLFGLGGSGKTQICVRYAQIHRDRYWGVFWVDASTRDNIHRSMTQIALLLQIEQDLDSVKRTLANASQLWLLVFDNADDPNLPLSTYFPTGDRGHILITSRDPASCQYGSAGHHELAQMSVDDAKTLMLRTVYGNSDVDEKTKQSCEKVTATLCYLALAITQAGAYLREMSCTFDEYLELYQRCRKEVMTYLPRHSTTDYRHSVYTTWQVSLDMIESRNDESSIYAIRILRLLGFYHYEQIPLAMFYNAWRNSRPGTADDRWLPWSSAFSNNFDLQVSVQASVNLLSSFSLVSRQSEASLSMHPLVHDWCRLRLPPLEQESASRQASLFLAQSIPKSMGTDDYTFRRSLVPHIRANLCVHKTETGGEDIEMVDQQYFMSLVLAENGSTHEALYLLEEVVQTYKTKLGEEHSDTLQSMHNLAIRYREAGRREEALQLTERVVQLRKSKLGEEHPETLRSMHNLAIRYSEAGRREEALQLIERVVQLRKSKLGEEHPETLRSMLNLAIRYSEVGRREEALQLTEQVVQLYKSKLGEEHPDTLQSMHNLAIRYSEAGRREEAFQLIEQVVQLRKSKLGEEHPDTLHSMLNLAIWYSEAGRREEALQLSEQVVQLRKSKLGEQHPDTLKSRRFHTFLLQENDKGKKDLSKEQATPQLDAGRFVSLKTSQGQLPGGRETREDELGRADCTKHNTRTTAWTRPSSPLTKIRQQDNGKADMLEEREHHQNPVSSANRIDTNVSSHQQGLAPVSANKAPGKIKGFWRRLYA